MFILVCRLLNLADLVFPPLLVYLCGLQEMPIGRRGNQCRIFVKDSFLTCAIGFNHRVLELLIHIFHVTFFNTYIPVTELQCSGTVE